eukprot:gene9106-12280_t
MNDGQKKKKRKANRNKNDSSFDPNSSSLNDSNDISMVGVDPNEPVYCTCKKISYGNMIACENENCLIEWYHFGCVGLKAA